MKATPMSRTEYLAQFCNVVNTPYTWAGHRNAESAWRDVFALLDKVSTAYNVGRFDVDTACRWIASAKQWELSAHRALDHVNAIAEEPMRKQELRLLSQLELFVCQFDGLVSAVQEVVGDMEEGQVPSKKVFEDAAASWLKMGKSFQALVRVAGRNE